MIISVCGLGFTGSGAVFDLLKEHTCIQTLTEEEFGVIYRPDGLLDLEYHLTKSRTRYMESDIAISRFIKYVNYLFREKAGYSKEQVKKIRTLTEEFVTSLCQTTWNGYWGYDGQDLSLLEKIKWKINSHFCPKKLNRKMYLSISPDGFNEKARFFLRSLLSILGYDGHSCLLLNQACSGDNPEASLRFFDACKAIIVKKDPRDLYVLCKKEVHSQCPWVPTDNVDDFISYVKTIYNFKTNELVVNFEDLIYDYSKTVYTIQTYCGIGSHTHTSKNKYFDPSVSIYNTQLFRKYPELESDILKIERELKEYLYDYSKVQALNNFKESF